MDRLLETHFEAIVYQTSTFGDNTPVYAHLDLADIVRELLEIPPRHGLVVDFPMVFTPDGGLRVTLVGEESAIADALADVPEAVNTSIERAGTYRRGAQRLYSRPTDR